MKNIVTVFLAILICASVCGESAKLSQLRTQKDAAIQRATGPIEAKYKNALEELLKVLTANEDLEGALKVKAEIDGPGKHTPSEADKSKAGSSRLELLRDQRESAIKRVVDPILSTYVDELERMQKSMTLSGKLEEAVEMKNELASLQKNSGESMGLTDGESGLAKDLIGSSWEMKQPGGTIMLKFEDGTFQVHKESSDGSYIPGDTRNWKVEDEKRRQIRIFWHYGEEVATMNSRRTTMKDSKNVMEKITD